MALTLNARRAQPDTGNSTGTPTPSTGPIYVPGLPTVNLVPPKYAAAVEQRQRMVQLGFGVIVALGALVLLFLGQSTQIALANSHLSDKKAALTKVLGQEADPTLVAASNYYTSVGTMEKTATGSMQSEVLYSVLLTDFQKDTPAGISYTSLSVATGGAATTGSAVVSAPTTCSSPDPFHTSATIGCITFSASAPNRAAVSALIKALGADSKNFADPFVASANSGTASNGSGVTFSGTVAITPAMLSGRYNNSTYLTGGK